MPEARAALGCCEGHRCDGCTLCLSGVCCGADVGEANLPAEGEWPTPLFSPVGVLEEAKGEVRCTLCGTWHVLLGQHLRWSHKGITADAYRAIAGLKASRALMPQCEIDRRSRAALAIGLDGRDNLPTFTTEQRSLLAFRREHRAEVRAKRALQPRDERGRIMRPINPEPVAVARLRPL